MNRHKINNDFLGSRFDSLAIIMTLPSGDDREDINWMNLRENATIDVNNFNTYEEAKEAAIEAIKEEVADRVNDYHRDNYNGYYREAEYEIIHSRYNYPDGNTYEQRFLIEIDNDNNYDLVNAEFNLANTYIDLFREEVLPISLK